jgi:type II secretory pathway pseudopilin PulG
MNMKFYRNAGFTLIEILVSAVILFGSIALSALIYKTAITNSLKAQAAVKLAANGEQIIDRVRRDLLQTERSQEQYEYTGKVNDVSFNVAAVLIKRGSAPDTVDPESGEIEKYPTRYRLWSVELNLETAALKKQFNYFEITW